MAPRIGVDADDVYVGTVFVDAGDFIAADFGNDGHRRVVGIHLVSVSCDLLHDGPHFRVGGRAIAFHLVADAPHQHGGKVFVAVNGGFGALQLRGDLSRVVIIEPLFFMAEPDTHSHAQS